MKQSKKLLTTDEEVAKILVEKQTQYEIQLEKVEKIIDIYKDDKMLSLSLSFVLYAGINAIKLLFLCWWEDIKGVFKREKNK